MPIASTFPELAVTELSPQGHPVATLCDWNVQKKPDVLAHQALLREIFLTPKPGLVDRRNSGAHRDMDIHTFMRSIEAISPWLSCFYEWGKINAYTPAADFLLLIRPTGLACEQAMFSATKGVNTHKGGVFAFGLLCGAAGRLEGRYEPLDAETICAEVAAICGGIVQRELHHDKQAATVGEHLFQRFGLTGARGEAASGYQTVRHIALPVYKQVLAESGDEETALLQTLMHLLAYNRDTNVVARGGMAGLEFVQSYAQQLLQQGGVFDWQCDLQGKAQYVNEISRKMAAFDDELIARNLSPGGSADLLAVTWFLAQYPLSQGHERESATRNRSDAYPQRAAA